MERLKHVKDTLLSAVEAQIGDLANVDAEELGEVVDMVKDMEEAMYYCSITKAMKEREEEEKYSKHAGSQTQYIPMYMPQQQPQSYRDMDRGYGRMYFEERGMDYRSGMRGRENMDYRRERGEDYGNSERRGEGYPTEIRDAREGKSPISRKNYIESKELHHGAPAQMKELEKYLQELSQDITEMIEDASPEEKAVLQQKLSILASKIK